MGQVDYMGCRGGSGVCVWGITIRVLEVGGWREGYKEVLIQGGLGVGWWWRVVVLHFPQTGSATEVPQPVGILMSSSVIVSSVGPTYNGVK